MTPEEACALTNPDLVDRYRRANRCAAEAWSDARNSAAVGMRDQGSHFRDNAKKWDAEAEVLEKELHRRLSIKT